MIFQPAGFVSSKKYFPDKYAWWMVNSCSKNGNTLLYVLEKSNTKKASGIITPLIQCFPFPRKIKQVLCALLLVYQLGCVSLDCQGAIFNVDEWIGICLKFQKSDVSNLESSEIKLQLPVNIKAEVECCRLLVFQWNFTQIIVILHSLQ